MATLIAHSRVDGSEEQWLQSGPDGRLSRLDSGRLITDRGKKRPGEVIWLIRSQDLTLLSKAIPSKRAGDLARAVPYAVEEELAVHDIDDCRFAISRTAADNEVSVAVVHGKKLQAGFERLRQAGVRPTRVVPDVLALDWQEGTWSVLVDGEYALVRTALTRGYAVDRPNLSWALQQSLANTPESWRPNRIRIWGGANTVAGLTLPMEGVPGGSAEAFEKGLETLPPINLLGQADTANQLGGDERRYLKLSAGLLVGVMFMTWASAWSQLHELDKYEKQLNQAISSLFRRAVPEAQRIVNPRAQLDQKLQRLRNQRSGSEGMLSQLADLSVRLGKDKDLVVRNMTYQEGTFLLKFNAGSVQHLDSIKSGIESSKRYQVTIESVDKQKDYVVGTIRVRGKNST